MAYTIEGWTLSRQIRGQPSCIKLHHGASPTLRLCVIDKAPIPCESPPIPLVLTHAYISKRTRDLCGVLYSSATVCYLPPLLFLRCGAQYRSANESSSSSSSVLFVLLVLSCSYAGVCRAVAPSVHVVHTIFPLKNTPSSSAPAPAPLFTRQAATTRRARARQTPRQQVNTRTPTRFSKVSTQEHLCCCIKSLQNCL